MGPAHELFPAFVVGQRVLDGDAVAGVVVPVTFPLLDSARQCSWPWLSGWRDGLAGVVAAQAQVAVVQQHLDQVEVAEAVADACGSGRGRIMQPPWP